MSMTAPRRASEEPFPYDGQKVCYIVITETALGQARYMEEKREAVRLAREGKAIVLAAWPGQWRTDLFLVDDIEKLAEALGMKPVQP